MNPLRILITGSSAGFGRLTALKLATQGHHVIATMRNMAKVDELLDECKRQGVELEVRPMDVSDRASVEAALHDAADIDVLINNAGFEIQGALELISDDLMLRQLDTNVLGPLRAIRAVMPSWRARGHGVIVNVSSVRPDCFSLRRRLLGVKVCLGGNERILLLRGQTSGDSCSSD